MLDNSQNDSFDSLADSSSDIKLEYNETPNSSHSANHNISSLHLNSNAHAPINTSTATNGAHNTHILSTRASSPVMDLC